MRLRSAPWLSRSSQTTAQAGGENSKRKNEVAPVAEALTETVGSCQLDGEDNTILS